MANAIAARISPELKEWFCGWLAEKSSRYLVAEESAERIHYHIYMEIPLGAESVKKILSERCKSLGLITKRGQQNAFYGGVKPCDIDFVKYCLKSQASVDATTLLYKGFEAEQITEWIVAGAKQHAEIQANGHEAPISTLTPDQKRKMDMDKFCDELVQRLKGKCDIHEMTVAAAHHEICKSLLQFKFARMNDNVAFPIVQSCLYRLFPHWVETEFHSRMARKFGGLFSGL